MLSFFSVPGAGDTAHGHGAALGSILNGIRSQLSDSSNDSQILTYQRSVDGFQGCCEELTEILRDYSSKAKILASRVQFLTAHNRDLKVLMVGESTGAQMGGEAMDILSRNPQVFSIQIGPPCWYHHDYTDRTLVITDNGIAPDSFSRGDALTIIKANLSALLSESETEDDRGTILKYLRAPGMTIGGTILASLRRSRGSLRRTSELASRSVLLLLPVENRRSPG